MPFMPSGFIHSSQSASLDISAHFIFPFSKRLSVNHHLISKFWGKKKEFKKFKTLPLNYFFKLLVHLLIACLSVLSSRILFYSSCTHFFLLVIWPSFPLPLLFDNCLTFLCFSDNYLLKHKPAYTLLSWICIRILNLTWKGAVLDSESPGLLLLLLKIEAYALHCSRHDLFVGLNVSPAYGE